MLAKLLEDGYGINEDFSCAEKILYGSNKAYGLGDEVFMLLTLMEEPERIPVAGKVVWITPIGAEGNRAAGIGVQFTDQDGGAARDKIEGYLGGALQTERPTHTM